ncbi:hypothetical protein JHK87_018908 [Glycine soja]|nr:hypothetical protein JHK87_018908 [Glycine soja]
MTCVPSRRSGGSFVFAKEERVEARSVEVRIAVHNGSLRSIFMHADGLDWFLMIFGLFGAIGDGIGTPLVLFTTSKIMNNIGGFSNNIGSTFIHNINERVIVFAIWAFMSYYDSRLVMYHGAKGGTVFAVGAARALV